MFRLENVTKKYSRHGQVVTAFHCTQLTIGANEFVAILGPSGSGKTTLLSLLGGMMSPTEGRVWLADESLYDLTVQERAHKRHDVIGFVFQAFNLISYLTARENVQVPLCISGCGMREQQERAEAILARFGLGDRLNHKPGELSIGQQQRVALARTLISNPCIILADEPTGNLDPDSRELVLKSFEECQREGRTIIMVTHDPVAAARAGRVLQLQAGELRDSNQTLTPKAVA